MSDEKVKLIEMKLATLHMILWHLRDEMGNKRGKQQLTLAIGVVEDIVCDVREASE